ncbi:MAG: hypothetical protein MUF42_00485 [Cytophagaceae bacterium]|jgi:hypothetical protein|nr:hypothetical protein [Cytophagaceae bacterium]
MKIPSYTQEIFQILAKGQFISSNGAHGRLYDLIRDEETFKNLREYFSYIGFTLESGFNYFYFSQDEEVAYNVEKKLEQFAHYIDVLDFFSTLDLKPLPGTRYRTTKVAEECYANERLKQKITALSRKDKLADKVAEVADFMTAASFFEKEDEETYKVLDSIHYLEQIINLITIKDDHEVESPQ